eukprot:TRINITY_DN2363_c0_g2_i1.p1 TRINITY_DN2363_c0_g2~~TRINITY_DN2363_c0_g2_i1.p1  ORF type:complete len:1499 (-),score=278.00 TRINITY_DN2363_c0_g2_i1:2715-6782(-)
MANCTLIGYRPCIEPTTGVVVVNCSIPITVNCTAPGRVFVYEQAGGWLLRHTLTIPAIENDTRSGLGVAVAAFNSDLAVSVGIPYGGTYVGSVRMYSRDEGGSFEFGLVETVTSWESMAQNPFDRFGAAVALSSDMLVVGAPDQAPYGAAYVFNRTFNGTHNWTPLIKLTAVGSMCGGCAYGASVAVSGDIVVVGSPWDNTDGFRAGAVFMYSRNLNNTGQWGFMKKFAGTCDHQRMAYFGSSLQIMGDTLLVSGPGEYGGTPAVYVYNQQQDGADQWGIIAQLDNYNDQVHAGYGQSISLDANFVVVGSEIDNFKKNLSGSVYMYKRGCSEGFYLNNTQCVACPQAYSSIYGSTSSGACFLCPLGDYTEVKPLCKKSRCIPCPASTYSNETFITNVTQCTTCPISNYCPGGTPAPIACPFSLYSDRPGLTRCKKCPNGGFTWITGAYSPSQCEGAFPQIESAEPSVCRLAGGCSITVRGFAFSPNAKVSVNDVTVNSSQVWVHNQTTLTFIAPPQPRAGYVNITVLDPDNPVNRSNVNGRDLFQTDDCPAIGVWGRGTNCMSCPAEAYCPGGFRLWPRPGYWGIEDEGFVTQCPEMSACLGGRDNDCDEGYSGPYCQTCESGYDRQGDNCVACPTSNAQIVILFVIGAVFFLSIIVAVLVQTDHGLNHTMLALGVLQLLRATGQMAGPELPVYIQQFYSFLALTTLDFSFLRPGCTFGGHSFSLLFYGTILIMIALVILTSGALLVVGRIRYAWRLLRKKDVASADKIWTWSKRRVVRSWLVLLTFLYFNITNVSISAIHCLPNASGTKLLLAADGSIECYTADHIPIAVVGYLLLLIVAGYPLMSVIFLIRKRPDLKDERLLALYGYIYEGFKFEQKIPLFFNVFTSLLTLALVLAYAVVQNDLAQLVLVLIPVSAFLITILVARPYRDQLEMVICTFTSLLSIFEVLLNYLGSASVPQTESLRLAREVLAYMIVASFVVLLIAIVLNFVIQYLLRRRRSDMKHHRKSLLQRNRSCMDVILARLDALSPPRIGRPRRLQRLDARISTTALIKGWFKKLFQGKEPPELLEIGTKLDEEDVPTSPIVDQVPSDNEEGQELAVIPGPPSLKPVVLPPLGLSTIRRREPEDEAPLLGKNSDEDQKPIDEYHAVRKPAIKLDPLPRPGIAVASPTALPVVPELPVLPPVQLSRSQPRAFRGTNFPEWQDKHVDDAPLDRARALVELSGTLVSSESLQTISEATHSSAVSAKTAATIASATSKLKLRARKRRALNAAATLLKSLDDTSDQTTQLSESTTSTSNMRRSSTIDSMATSQLLPSSADTDDTLTSGDEPPSPPTVAPAIADLLTAVRERMEGQ